MVRHPRVGDTFRGSGWRRGGNGARPPGFRHRLQVAVAVAVFAVAPIFATASFAQTYPLKSIRFIVPFPPGGGDDIVGRIVALKLSEGLGQSVVVDNRGGAGGIVGTEITAKSPPDGYTMLINNISLAVNATLVPGLPYNTLKDLAPVTLVGRQPNVLVVYPGVPVKTMRDLIALAKSKPKQINYGSGGIGTASHLATELLKMMAGVDIVHVPYKGLGPALTDLMGGQIQLIISTMASAMPQVKAGKLRPIAVTTAKRSSFFPEVPTMDEAGVRGYEFDTWYGLLMSARTPRAIIDRVNREMAKVAGSPTVKEQFTPQGLETAHTSPEEFASYLKSEVSKWGKVIRASGARPD
jgi:tripartite-type tricarboxylate transporter receptor subunit TctC